MKKWLIRIVLVVMVLAMLYFLLTGRDKNNEEFTEIPVKRGDIAEKALAVGTIEPEMEIKVKSTIPGIVSEVLFKVGDEVEAGMPLFTISPNPN